MNIDVLRMIVEKLLTALWYGECEFHSEIAENAEKKIDAKHFINRRVRTEQRRRASC